MRINELIYVKHLEECLACSSVNMRVSYALNITIIIIIVTESFQPRLLQKKKKKKAQKRMYRDFPGGAVVEHLPANAGDMGSSPGLGRSHMLRSN